MCDRIWVPPCKHRKDQVNIETILKDEFLSPFLPLYGFNITLYCQDFQSLHKHKENQSPKDGRHFPFSWAEGWNCFLSQQDCSYCLFNFQGRGWKHPYQMVVSSRKSLFYVLAWDAGIFCALFRRWCSGLTSELFSGMGAGMGELHPEWEIIWDKHGQLGMMDFSHLTKVIWEAEICSQLALGSFP